MSELSVIGKPLPRVDALEKVTGRGRFTTDFHMPGMLYAKIKRSPYPHAKILSIDTSKAEKLPGVRGAVTGKDVPQVRLGFILKDQAPLCWDNVVRAIGEPVAAVAADTIEIAEEAVDLIDIEYEELPAVFDVEEAARKEPPAVVHPERTDSFLVPQFVADRKMEPEPNVAYHFHIHKEDVEKGFEEADFIVENRYWAPRVQHCQLETAQYDAWVEPDGTLNIRSSCGIPWVTSALMAQLFNLPISKVRNHIGYIGGAFGLKAGTAINVIPSLLAMKTGRPVRLVYTREEHFSDGVTRVAVVTYIKDGVKRDGTLVARKVTTYVDTGRHADTGVGPATYGAYACPPTYRMSNFQVDTHCVWTNSVLGGAFRGFGVSEVNWGLEQQMDILAEKIGMDPVEFRRKNILMEGEVDVSGMTVHSIGARECLDKAAEWIEWGKEPEPAEGPWKRGKGIAMGSKYTAANFASGAYVKVHPEGTIEVRHGGSEVGQGLNSVVAQTAAEEFGTSIDQIKIVYGDTSICPFETGPMSSHCTFYVGNAVKRACQDAKRQIFDIASGILRVNPGTLEVRDGKIYVTDTPGKWIPISDLFMPMAPLTLKGGEIMGKDSFTLPRIPQDVETGQSARPVAYYAHVCQAVQVAVNTETGEVKVEKIGSAYDMGTPINVKMCEQQIEGGMAMGISVGVYEEMVFDKGRVVNPSFMDYKIPTFMELPRNENVKPIIAYVPHREGPYGAKGLGEGVMTPTASAIANAVYNAVGVRIYGLPISREKVWKAMREAKQRSEK